MTGDGIVIGFNNTNTFAWSGPRGVVGCTGQAPFGSPVPCVPLNPLIRWTARKPRREKDYALGLVRVTNCHTRTR
jgi:hypothetical protein